MDLGSFKVELVERPGWRTVVSIRTSVLTGVLSGTFVYEITGPQGLDWSSFYESKSFYGLLVTGFLLYAYNRAVYDREHEVERFMDDEYCVAYVRSKCLPEAANRYRQQIRDGEGGELVDAMNEIKRMLE